MREEDERRGGGRRRRSQKREEGGDEPAPVSGLARISAKSNCTVSNLVFVYTDTMAVAHVKTVCIKVS